MKPAKIIKDELIEGDKTNYYYLTIFLDLE